MNWFKQNYILGLLERSQSINQKIFKFSVALEILNKDLSEEAAAITESMKDSAYLAAVINKEKQKNINIINGLENLLNGNNTTDSSNKESSINKEKSC